jgi:hypothetical protein
MTVGNVRYLSNGGDAHNGEHRRQFFMPRWLLHR